MADKVLVRVLVNKVGFETDKASMIKAESAVKGFKTRATSLIGSIGKAAVAGGLLMLGKAAIDAARNLEMLQANFATLLGSAEKAQGFVDNLRQFAARTPYTTEGLARASKVMLAFGISADKVMGHLSAIGDVALGSDAKMQSLALAFSQVQATGRLMGQDLLQMINAGFNPLEIMSQKTGKSMAELKKMMEKGMISAQDVADAFKIATSEGGRFYKGMEKASLTLDGLISTMQDNLGMLLANLGNSLMPVIRKLVVMLIDLTSGPLGQLLDKLVQALIPILDWLIKLIDELFVAIMPLTDTLMIVADLFTALLPLIQPIFKLLKPIGIIIESLNKAFKAMMPVLQIVFELFGEIVDVLVGELSTFIIELAPLLAETFRLLAEILIELMPIIKPLVRLFVWMVSTLVKIGGRGITKGLTILLSIFNAILKVLAPILGGLSFLFDRLLAIGAWLGGQLGQAITKGFSNLGNALGGILNVIWEKISGFFTWIWDNVLKGVWESIQKFVQPLADFLAQVFAAPIQFIQDMWNKLLTWIVEQINRFIKLIEPLIDWVNKLPGVNVKVAPLKAPTAAALGGAATGSKSVTVSQNFQMSFTGAAAGDPQGVAGAVKEAAKSALQFELRKVLMTAGF